MDDHRKSVDEGIQDIGARTNSFSADAEAPKLYSRSDEEFAAELAEGRVVKPDFQPNVNIANGQAENTGQTGQITQGRAWGITAIILAIASWFIWPTLLAPAALITGFIAFTQGRRSLGTWAIVISLIAFIVNIAATPLFR